MKQWVKSLFLALLLVILIGAVLRMRDFGRPVMTGMDEYFIENAQQEAGANNVVASVVFDYRGLDTLGEATVLFTAVAGVVLLFREAGK